MRSNYPPGVTGNEYEINGPDREWEGPPDRNCRCGWPLQYDEETDDYVSLDPEDPGWPREVQWEEYQGSMWWHCPHCNGTVDVPLPEPDYEPDPEEFI